MSARSKLRNGAEFLLVVQLDAADTGLFPQAEVRNSAGTLLDTEDLSHVTDGKYTGTYTMGSAALNISYFVYTDSGHTTLSTKYRPADESIDVEDSSVPGDEMDILSATEDNIVDKVWDEPQSGHTTASTFGKYLDLEVSTVNATAIGIGTAVTTLINNLNDLDASEVAAAVWDAVRSSYNTAGSMGEFMDDTANLSNLDAAVSDVLSAISALNNLSSSQAATAVWNSLLSSFTTVGTMGANQNLIDNIPADVDTELSGTHGAGSWETAAASDLISNKIKGTVKTVKLKGTIKTTKLIGKIKVVKL